MREHEHLTQRELERRIEEICGVKVGPHFTNPKPTIDPNHYWDIDGFLCEWMRKIGCNEAQISRIHTQNGGRARLYCAGAVWVQNNIIDGDNKPQRRNSRFGSRVDTSGFSFDDKPKQELSDLLGLPSGFKEEIETDSSDEDKILLTQSMLKNATDAILGPQVEEFKKSAISSATQAIKDKLSELDSEIREKVRVEISIERTEATNRAVKEATETAITIALKACEDYIEKRVPRRIEFKTPTKTKLLTDEPRHKAFEEILFWAAQGVHVYMWGPRGTGKTHLFPQIAEALDKRYIPIGQSLSKYDVTGYTSATGDYIKTHARDAMENGGLLGVDEGDTWAAAALIALNTPLANKYCPFPDKIVNVHDDFLCMVAANTSGFGATPEYQGRNPLDSTSTDRFAFVHVDYDEDMEIALFGNTPWVRYIHEVRSYVRRELKQVAALPSMRPIQMGTKALAAGGDPEMVCRGALWKALPQDMINRIENSCGKFGRRHLQEVETEAA